MLVGTVFSAYHYSYVVVNSEYGYVTLTLLAGMTAFRQPHNPGSKRICSGLPIYDKKRGVIALGDSVNVGEYHNSKNIYSTYIHTCIQN